jgi:hypothetical protein
LFAADKEHANGQNSQKIKKLFSDIYLCCQHSVIQEDNERTDINQLTEQVTIRLRSCQETDKSREPVSMTRIRDEIMRSISNIHVKATDKKTKIEK